MDFLNFSDIAVGDKVLAKYSHLGGAVLRIETVKKVTKTQFVTDEARYSRKWGSAVGNEGNLHAERLTPENVERFEKWRFETILRNNTRVLYERWKDIPRDLAVKILDLVGPFLNSLKKDRS